MKKSVLLSIIGVLLVVGVGITFAYFTSGVEVSGEGATVELDSGDMIKVSYDAGDNSLSSNNLIPGQTLTKTFTVTITPTAKENTASYSIYLDLTNNTFVKCDDSNYDSITNACIKDYEGVTLVHCHIEPDIDYMKLSEVVKKQFALYMEQVGNCVFKIIVCFINFTFLFFFI